MLHMINFVTYMACMQVYEMCKHNVEYCGRHLPKL